MKCTHIRSEPVRETFEGRTVWDGVVEIFACMDGSAMLVYAWADETDEGGQRYVSVLGVPPIKSAHDAVRASIAGAARKSLSRVRPASDRRLPAPGSVDGQARGV